MQVSRILSFVLLSLLVGCNTENGKDIAPAPVPSGFVSAEGKRLFSHYCSPCHGESGDGSGQFYGFALEVQPADFTSPEFMQTRDASQLRLVVREGSSAVGQSNLCPPWGNTLFEVEIDYLVSHVQGIGSRGNQEIKDTLTPVDEH